MKIFFAPHWLKKHVLKKFSRESLLEYLSLVMTAVKDQARADWELGPGDWDRTFEELKESLSVVPSPEQQLEEIVKWMVGNAQSDIFVLAEVPKYLLQGDDPKIASKIHKKGGPKYRVLTAMKGEDLDETSNVVILCKEDVFLDS